MHSNESPHQEPIWIFPSKNGSLRDAVVKEFKIHPTLADILIARGFLEISEIHDYLYSKLPNLIDPFLLNEMQKAVDRILLALEKKENILIYGDNDVDGMTGSALLVEFFRFIGANVFFYISNRSMRRQSLIVEALDYALKNECRLLITVDCGITAAPEIAQVNEQGVDVIITDHHEPGDDPPACIATLNPKVKNSKYPNIGLTGVGVAFKLAHAMTISFQEEGRVFPKKIDLKKYLDLVALGTVADMGSLLGENRILVSYGLRQLQKTKRIGLRKLISVAGIGSLGDPPLDTDEPLFGANEITTYSIGSKIAPRLNSLGRIDDPRKGVELLLVRNSLDAEKMAEELNLNNLKRQEIEKGMVRDVGNILHLHPEILQNKAIVLFSEGWHPGIIAILCARLSKTNNRPCIVLTIDKDIAKGSLRSIPEFPLLDVLKEFSDILLNFGGHDLACGLSIKKDHLPLFQEKFIAAANKKLKDEDVKPKLFLDAETFFHELTFDFLESLKLLEPYGNENPPPLLYTRARQAWPPKVIHGNHLKLYLINDVEEEMERMVEGMAFGKAYMLPLLKKRNLHLEIVYTPQVHPQGGSIQLIVRDIHILGVSEKAPRKNHKLSSHKHGK